MTTETVPASPPATSRTTPVDAEAVAARIEEVLAELAGYGEPVRDAGEDLVRSLMAFYEAGLSRLVERLDHPSLVHLATDDTVAALLILHGLHPLDVQSRIGAALEQVRPLLGSHAGDVTVVGVDDAGVLHLALEGNCHGCPSSALTVQNAIEAAVRKAAPELTGVEVAGVVDPAGDGGLLQIGRRPPDVDVENCPAGPGRAP